MNEEQFEARKAEGAFVPLPSTLYARIRPGLDEKYRWVHPWVRDFILDESQKLGLETGDHLVVTSATRPVAEQLRVIRTSRRGNAASVEEGPMQSCHLTASCIDIGKRNLSAAGKKVLQENLMTLHREGFIEVMDKSDHFHVMVFRHYGGREYAAPAEPVSQPETITIALE